MCLATVLVWVKSAEMPPQELALYKQSEGQMESSILNESQWKSMEIRQLVECSHQAATHKADSMTGHAPATDMGLACHASMF